jgi:hypothetical protein
MKQNLEWRFKMKQRLQEIARFDEPELVDKLLQFIDSPEFAALYAQRMKTLTNFGLGDNFNLKWSIAMSSLTDAMTAACTALNAKSGLTPDAVTAQIHSIVDPQISNLNSTITSITSSEADDASKIADITAALGEFTTAFAPATTPAASSDTNTVAASLAASSSGAGNS